MRGEHNRKAYIMKKIKSRKGWAIYQNSAKEIEECGFAVTILHPDNMEFDKVVNAVDWINNY